jgi:acyl carrier protein
VTGAPDALYAELVALLAQVTGEDAAWVAGVRSDSRLDGDLLLDSIELAALGEKLRERYGRGVDLAAYLAGLDLDQLIDLTVGDLVDHVVEVRSRAFT